MPVKFQGKDAFFIIHIEHQSTAESRFNRRMFHYFARIHEKFGLPVYPILICSYDQPRRPEKSVYTVEFPDRKVLSFSYVVIQLNRLNWRDFLQNENPVAAALMAKMNIKPEDRPKVKAECLRMLVTLELNPAKMRFISGFVDTYLRLDEQEEETFQAELNKMGLVEQETVMEIVTSWMEEGIERGRQEGRQEGRKQGRKQGRKEGRKEGLEQGLRRGRQEGESSLVLRLLNRRLGPLSPAIETQVRNLPLEQLENLGEALLDFQTESDLTDWLAQN